MVMIFAVPILTALMLFLAVVTKRWVFKAALVAIFLSYVAAVGVISYDPYFDDAGSREFIEWRFRWVWAGELCGILLFVTMPVVLAIGAVYRRVRYGRIADDPPETAPQ